MRKVAWLQCLSCQLTLARGQWIFPTCWILTGQFKFPARQPYARRVRRQISVEFNLLNGIRHVRNATYEQGLRGHTWCPSTGAWDPKGGSKIYMSDLHQLNKGYEGHALPPIWNLVLWKSNFPAHSEKFGNIRVISGNHLNYSYSGSARGIGTTKFCVQTLVLQVPKYLARSRIVLEHHARARWVNIARMTLCT